MSPRPALSRSKRDAEEVDGAGDGGASASALPATRSELPKAPPCKEAKFIGAGVLLLLLLVLWRRGAVGAVSGAIGGGGGDA